MPIFPSKLLGEEWGIKDDEIATFGDSGNDLEMLQHTTHSYAMQNAQENVKHAANTIIGSNDSEAVLDTIESFILD
ncbi:HAD hydrolase family protein [Listeria booriae]|uniref:HAD hydrolase family protein n=1 Tax=Listeria booriae TaxID=1552123 RepID=UPI0028930814|nr:HAD hydrolase family protein [Listeria booriae]